MAADDPKPRSYKPFVAARFPGKGKAPAKPKWRIVVHRKQVDDWNRILDVAGEANAGELWFHLAMQPDQAPRLGTVTPMKGNQYAKKDGMSRVFHYELTGGARVDYRHNAEYVAGKGDKHRVVQIVLIDLSSH